MDLDALISEICKRVQERVAACEMGEQEIRRLLFEEEKKPVLLVIAQDHGETCHPTLINEALTSCYEMRCALLEENWEVEACEGVIAYTLTNEALGKIVNGIFDTPYTKAFGKALLLGKKIFIPEKEVELYRYKDTAPKAYYKRLEANIDFLKENGVMIVSEEQLVKEILGEEEPKAPSKEIHTEQKAESSQPIEQTVKEMVITHEKRVLSERDLISAKAKGVTKILVTEKTMVTDLAKDYARKYKIVIERQIA